MALAVFQLFLVTIVVIIYCIVIVLSNDVYIHLYITNIYMFITCVRHNEKNEAKLDENLISIVMVILRAVYTYKKYHNRIQNKYYIIVYNICM